MVSTRLKDTPQPKADQNSQLAPAKQQQGVTLIELMITIAIMGLLLMVSAPLTRAWVANAHIAQDESQLLQAYARTRALALRNPNGVTASSVAATLMISTASQTISVLDSTNSVAWRRTTQSDTTVSITTNSGSSQLTLDNSGLPLNASGTMSYTVSASGGTSASGTLH